jgi:hypothetical protein
MRISRYIVNCGVAVIIAGAALAGSQTPANASPVLVPDMTGRSGMIVQESNPKVEQAQYRGRGQYRRGNREFRRAGRRDYRRNYHYGNRPYRRHSGSGYRYWGPGIGLGFFFGQGLFYPPPPVFYTPVPRVAGACTYWLARCEANWRRPVDIRGCLRYQGCL